MGNPTLIGLKERGLMKYDVIFYNVSHENEALHALFLPYCDKFIVLGSQDYKLGLICVNVGNLNVWKILKKTNKM